MTCLEIESPSFILEVLRTFACGNSGDGSAEISALVAQPFHASLHFKEVRPKIWSVRISQSYRALGQEIGDAIVWYWIGTHDDYDARV